MTQRLDTVFDATTAMAAVTVPFWLQDIELWGRALVILGGLVLLVLRILCAWHELRRGRDV
jgi:hypothetical protein